MKVYVNKKGQIIKTCKDSETPKDIKGLKEVKNVKEGEAIAFKFVKENINGFNILKMIRKSIKEK
jgi:hypothetical protein